ncbi:hypothetical protein PZN02_003513 [Sinorhizobium garamanticum]|uniref:Uncharacterized protein n=1 Tax=Sinorhizobium garamanticum TaxID=680247 RepID=A0ABY8D8D3_9HYPH|nr:hypothetical protein [Sinorhizobium garamanticum]WEX87153.1 hypothetical protein PZN02_003513 [Sinorhizobium garamanticum]
MTDIVFTIRASVSIEQRARVLTKIQAMPDVELAGPIKRDSSSETLQRIHFARLREHSEATSCLSAIRELPEVESANLPARRGL